MADNTTLNSGTGGDVIASDDISGVKHQRIKLIHGDDGVNAGDVSLANPLPVQIPAGEILEAIEALRMSVQALSRTIGLSMPDAGGRLRVLLDSISASLTLSAVTTVTTVTTCATLTNQTQVGGLSATEQIPSLMRLGADQLRGNIAVS